MSSKPATGDEKLAVKDTISKLERNEQGNLVCPWCPFESVTSDQERAFRLHMFAKHRQAALAAWQHPELGMEAYQTIIDAEKVADGMDVMVEDGFEVTDTLDSFDYFKLPPELLKRVQQDGGRFRFVTNRKFDTYRSWGAIPVARPVDLNINPNQPSTENSNYRVNELTLMYFHDNLVKRRDKMKRRAVEDLTHGMVSRQEDSSRTTSDQGKAVYDHYIKNGMPPENAMMLAHRAEKQQSRVTNRGFDPEDTGLEITRGPVN
jgi:hypothetical protein